MYHRLLLILHSVILQTISVALQEVELEEKSSGGCWDYVALYDGPTVSSSEISSYCTRPTVSTVTSSGSSVLVVFVSDFSNPEGRFSLSWTFASSGQGGFMFRLSPYYSHAVVLLSIIINRN